MDNETEVVEQQPAEPVETNETPPEAPDEAAKPEAEEKAEEKPAKTPEQRQLERAERKIDRLVRQREELRAQLQQGLQSRPIDGTNQPESDDSEPLTLSRAELQALIDKKANEIAPKITEQRAEIEHRRKVVGELEKAWGKERFDGLASDLDEALGGLADRSGKPKPATDAIFEADKPQALIEYLADPDHADEAEAIGRMSAIQAARAITKLEAKLEAQAKEEKPQRSKAPAPLEPIRGAANPSSALPQDTDSTEVWMKKERARMKAKGLTSYG